MTRVDRWNFVDEYLCPPRVCRAYEKQTASLLGGDPAWIRKRPVVLLSMKFIDLHCFLFLTLFVKVGDSTDFVVLGALLGPHGDYLACPEHHARCAALSSFTLYFSCGFLSGDSDIVGILPLPREPRQAQRAHHERCRCPLHTFSHLHDTLQGPHSLGEILSKTMDLLGLMIR